MKNFLKKLRIGSKQSEDSESALLSKGNTLNDGSPNEGLLQFKPEHKPFSSISGWLNSVTDRHSPSPPSSSNITVGEKMEPSDSVGSSSLDATLDSMKGESASSNPRERDIEEDYQIQLALELSAKEDPEAAQIEAVKQISLGSCPPDTLAEVVAYRYWNYNALSYDDEILDGFYDLYGIFPESIPSRMPSVVDLQGKPLSDDISWEAILVNKAADTKLLTLEQKALEMAFRFRLHSDSFVTHKMVQKLATLVSDHMGGSVGDPDSMLSTWKNLIHTLKANHGSMVYTLGSLTIGLARHRALLFKVLADSLGIPCRLVKGRWFTGSDDAAMVYVKIDREREYIVDLMSDPGTLIPSDGAGAVHLDYKDPILSASLMPEEVEPSHEASSTSKKKTSSLYEDTSDGKERIESKLRRRSPTGKELMNGGEYLSSVALLPKPPKSRGSEHNAFSFRDSWEVNKERALKTSSRPLHPYAHARSPSWTEGVSSPAVESQLVKDVSQYMINAAKENPQLAQKLHAALLESGVAAPPHLFSEMHQEQLVASLADVNPPMQRKELKGHGDIHETKGHSNLNHSFLPPLPYHGFHCGSNTDKHPQHQLNPSEVIDNYPSSGHEAAPAKFNKNVPVAAAAAAAAAAVASSMVVAVAKANCDPKLQFPVAAAATATAAAVVATTAAVTKQYESLESAVHLPEPPGDIFRLGLCVKSDREADITSFEHGDPETVDQGGNFEGERISDRSTGNESSKSDIALDDVADCEIPWEEITMGERIGLGSYGEVYRGEWHGTEVAVKKFLNQDLIDDSLEEFKSEVRIMKRVRHPNVVLFMGAVTGPPNLSIVTEFLHRGSLYRLIHRPNNQLDERRRLRMALDTARGMNYLHNCTPVIVHRDLKSPNLLVDKNWVVKVCDFGLSRMKHSTFLSSRSTAGTAEWMSPEVLRNEPCNEKTDVYSFGIILWELCTLQQPWQGMNPMQVVGAVGFQNRRLSIPDDMDPVIADIITKCWQTDPNLRPSFAEIMAALKPLQKPITSSQVPRPNKRPGKVGSSVNLQDF